MQEIKTDVYLFKAALDSASLFEYVVQIEQQAAFRHLQVASGQSMSVAMTNCGPLGWYSDLSGYRYTSLDPLSGQPWPAMPERLKIDATAFALQAGWPSFVPDACLINRYAGTAKMGLHQDRDERDFSQPIVSVSLGARCQFLVGGLKRRDPTTKIELDSGDVLVWGKSARLMFHGVASIKTTTEQPLRYNFTFRRAG
jgi:DNA oxidative demethylase